MRTPRPSPLPPNGGPTPEVDADADAGAPAVVVAGSEEPGGPSSDEGAGPGGHDHGDPADHARLRSANRPGVPWTRMLFIGAVCFAVWLLLDAPSLQHSATVSPVGSRRTVALDVVGPIAALSRTVGVSHVVGWTDQALGRPPGGGPSLALAVPGRAHRLPHPPAPVPSPAGPGAATGPTSTTTTTFPVLDQHPSGADPLRVLVVGDSIGIDLGQPLVNDLAATGVVAPVLDGRVDTGLSRPDYFDWPAELRVDMANDRPQLVVVMMGANDPQSLVDGAATTPYGTPEWNAAYGQRIGAFVDEANAAGAYVLWVGMPPMSGSELDGKMQVLNSVAQSEVAARPAGATYLSSTAVLGDGQGNYTAYLPNASGAEVNIRTPDGIHLAPGGGERLSQAVLAAMHSTLHIDLTG